MANKPKPLYLCDRKKCDHCSYPQCKFTSDATHQLKIEDKYTYETLIDRLSLVAEGVIDKDISPDEVADTLMAARNALIYWCYYNKR